mgnify:CR=1 FL=1
MISGLFAIVSTLLELLKEAKLYMLSMGTEAKGGSIMRKFLRSVNNFIEKSDQKISRNFAFQQQRPLLNAFLGLF